MRFQDLCVKDDKKLLNEAFEKCMDFLIFLISLIKLYLFLVKKCPFEIEKCEINFQKNEHLLTFEVKLSNFMNEINGNLEFVLVELKFLNLK